MRIRRPTSTNESRLRGDRVAFIKAGLIDRFFLKLSVATVQLPIGFNTHMRGEHDAVTLVDRFIREGDAYG